MATTDLNRVWLRTEKVAGSSPAERAPEMLLFAGKTWSQSKGPGSFPALLAATWQQPVKVAVLPAC